MERLERLKTIHPFKVGKIVGRRRKDRAEEDRTSQGEYGGF